MRGTVLCIVLLGTRPATADAPDDAPIVDTCVSVDEVIERAEKLAGRRIAALAQVDITTEQLPTGRWRARTTIAREGVGVVRDVEGETCGAVLQAASVVVAMHATDVAIDILPTSPELAPRMTAARTQPSVSSPTIDDGEPANTTPERTRFALGTWTAGSTGLLDRPAFGFGLSGVFLFPRMRLVMSAGYFLPQEMDVPVASEEIPFGSRFDALVFGTHVCMRVWDGVVRTHFCGGMEAGVMRGRGLDVLEARTGIGLWAAASARAAFVYSLASNLDLSLEIGPRYSVVRPRFGVDGRGEIFEPAAFGIHGALGLEWVFGS